MLKINIDKTVYSIMDLSKEEIEGEYLAYNSESEIIIVFNKTASLIWDYIVGEAERNKNITSEEICNMIANKYNIPESEFYTIRSDVSELLSSFVKRKILGLSEYIN